MAMALEGDGSAEWGEICDDHGFIYRVRRQAAGQASVATDAAAEAPESMEESETELRRLLRKRKLSCLRGLREKYKRELEMWERLTSTVNQLSEQAPERVCVDLRSMNVDGSEQRTHSEVLGRHHSLDELLFQVECQEAMFRKIEEICSDVDALCEEKEEKSVNMLLELPIWSSPRTLLKSLQD